MCYLGKKAFRSMWTNRDYLMNTEGKGKNVSDWGWGAVYNSLEGRGNIKQLRR